MRRAEASLSEIKNSYRMREECARNARSEHNYRHSQGIAGQEAFPEPASAELRTRTGAGFLGSGQRSGRT